MTVAAAGPAGEASGIDTTLEQFARGVTGQGRAGRWQSFLRNELKIPAEAPAEGAMGPDIQAAPGSRGHGRQPHRLHAKTGSHVIHGTISHSIHVQKQGSH
jgi:hypothetical protein